MPEQHNFFSIVMLCTRGGQCVLYTLTLASFTTISCSLLITKLVRYGLEKWMIRWVENWLWYWAQQVVISDTKSIAWWPLATGVPQEALLGQQCLITSLMTWLTAQTAFSMSVQMTPNWGEQLLLFRGTLTAWRNGLTGISRCSIKANTEPCTWDGMNQCKNADWGSADWETAFLKRTWQSWRRSWTSNVTLWL